MANNLASDRIDKKEAVRSMFDSIAWRYDFLNHFLSFSFDRFWRKKAIKIIAECKKKPAILDVATGTGDLAFAAMKLDPSVITGIDISGKMLNIARKKAGKKGLSEKIDFLQADSEDLPFNDNSFDTVMVAFGIRNFSDPLKGLCEMKRVLRNEGMIMVLEFSKPTGIVFGPVYNFYFRRILPFLGKLLSKDSHAYTYLPESVMTFPDNEKFLKMLDAAGFSNTSQTKLTGGVASIYTGINVLMQ